MPDNMYQLGKRAYPFMKKYGLKPKWRRQPDVPQRFRRWGTKRNRQGYRSRFYRQPGFRYSVPGIRPYKGYERPREFILRETKIYTIGRNGQNNFVEYGNLLTLKGFPIVAGALAQLYDSIRLKEMKFYFHTDKATVEVTSGTEYTRMRTAYDDDANARIMAADEINKMRNVRLDVMEPGKIYYRRLYPKWSSTVVSQGAPTLNPQPILGQGAQWFDMAFVSTINANVISSNGLHISLDGTAGNTVRVHQEWVIEVKGERMGQQYTVRDDISTLQANASTSTPVPQPPKLKLNIPEDELANDSFEEYVRSFHGKTKKRMNYDTASPQEARMMPLN